MQVKKKKKKKKEKKTTTTVRCFVSVRIKGTYKYVVVQCGEIYLGT